ncbi:hypothetical protein [Brevundimonas nasdae]|uniref:hypothetical protein n=1 Tax=Brevundimonas nasdae TaxID=172043 RepID=UPI0028991FF2|nr:hypothetical protein [Brevundimonas nasdae]
MLALTIYLAGFAALGLVSLFAWAKGGALERQAAVVIAGAWLLSAVVPLSGRASPAWSLVAIDVLLLIYLSYLAAFSQRRWPIAAAGFQLLIVANHFAFARNLALEQWAYFTAYYIWSWGVLGALAVGAARTLRRRQTNG